MRKDRRIKAKMRRKRRVMAGLILLGGFYWEYWFCRWWDYAGKGVNVQHEIIGLTTGVVAILLVMLVWIVMEIRYDLIMERGYVRYMDSTGVTYEMPIAEAYGKVGCVHKRTDGSYYVDFAWDEPIQKGW